MMPGTRFLHNGVGVAPCTGAVLVMLWGIPSVSGQPFTTVQLPTFQQFSVGTTVVVPDQGSVSLGGIDRYSERSRRLGLPGALPHSREYGRNVGGTGVSVHAWIHDHEELDQQVLQQWERREKETQPAKKPVTSSSTSGPVRGRSPGKSVLPEPAVNSAESLALRRQRKLDAQARLQEEIRTIVRSGDQAHSLGDLTTARIQYRTALRLTPDSMAQARSKIIARLRRTEDELATVAPSPSRSRHGSSPISTVR